MHIPSMVTHSMRCIGRYGVALSLILSAINLATTGCSPTPAAQADHLAVHQVSSTSLTSLDIGSPSPDFTLPDAHGGSITLSQVSAHRPVLLIFYLGYSCPRCVTHLREIAERKKEFDKMDAQILAISPDTVAESKDSINAYGDFPFPMLSDPDMKVAKKFGLVLGEDNLFHGAFIVDTHNTIRFAMKSSHPYDNIEALLANLNSLQQ